MLDFTPENRSEPLRKPWRQLITVGRAYELMRGDLIAQLERAQSEIGWSYCRFHGLFHDEMGVVTRDADGGLQFAWHQVDKVFDTLLRLGLRPFIELNPMPTALASGERTMFFYKMNVTPPRDFSEWGQLVETLARHCIERYGLEEVRQWYFEVWNEPNFPCFWDGTQEEYFELYRQSALAVKRADSALRIGGPATAQAAWVPELITFCETTGTPLDFVSTHSYPQDEPVFYPDLSHSPHRPGSFFGDCFRKVQSQVKASTRPDLEIHWTEWNALSAPAGKDVSWTENPVIDRSGAGSFAVKECLELDTACDSMGWWVLSDLFEEAGMPHAPFSSTYGLLTIHGLPKASYHAFRFLNKLRGERLLPADAAPTPDGCGCVLTREAGTLRLLSWNHPALHAETKPVWTARLRLPWTGGNSAVALSAQVSPEKGSGFEAWRRMGSPQDPSPFEFELLKAACQPDYQRQLLTPENATLEWTFELPPYAFRYAEIKEPSAPAHGKGQKASKDDSDTLETQLSGH